MRSFVIVMTVVVMSVMSMKAVAVNEPEIQWEKTFGGANDDAARFVQETSDCGYIITGWTKSFGAGSQDVFLIKIDSAGNLQWQKTFGGSSYDDGFCVQQTLDGGYIVVGYTESFGFGNDLYLVKTDSAGNMEWQKTHGGTAAEEGRSIQQTPDGGYIIAGYTCSYGTGGGINTCGDTWLIKTDPAGNIEWHQTFGTSGTEGANAVLQTSDGGYILACGSYPQGPGGWDAWSIKTDSVGNMLWEKFYGGSDNDGIAAVQKTIDGGYMFAGNTMSFGAGPPLGYGDVWMIKTDSAGDMQWNKTFGGSGDDMVAADSMRKTSDGGYIIAGFTDSYGAGGRDFYLIKTNSAGGVLWQKTIGGQNDDSALSVQQLFDGGYVAAGLTESYGAGGKDVYLVKIIAPELACTIYDDFESYDVGSYPTPKWSMLYSGNYAQVSDEQAYSGVQSFKLVGRYNWSRADVVSVSFPENFTYSFAVMIAPGSAGGCVGIARSWGGASPVNGVNFNPDGDYFTWEGPEIYPHLLEECIRDKWYKVNVTIRNFSSDSPTADVTIGYDGTSVTHTGIPAYPRDLANRNLLQLHTFSRAATQIYYDDICIAEAPKPKSLVAYWSFDDSTDPGHDDSGNGHDGIVNGAEPTNGICGNALSFDGVDDHVDMGLPSELRITGPLTVGSWFLADPAALTEHPKIVSRCSRDIYHGYSWETRLYWGRPEGWISQNGYQHILAFGSEDVSSNEWYHLAMTYQPDEFIKLYLDGEPVGEVLGSVVPDYINDPEDVPIFVGAFYWEGVTPGSPFTGKIDEVRIYDRALSKCEIKELAIPCEPLFAVYGLHSLHLQQAVINGNVGANNAQSGEWINPYLPYEIEIGAATINGSAYGDTVKLGPGAHVTGDAYCNEAIIWYDYGAILDGSEVSPLVLPVPDPSPAFPVFAAGIDDITVNSGDIMTLQPGDYGKVELKKGYWNSSTVLQLEGGVYNLGELVLGYNTRVECLNPCEIRIKGRLSAVAVAAIIPAVESDLSAGDIQIFVEGINGTTGGVSETPKAVVLGTVTDTQAHIYAPNGTIEIGGNKTTARGVFIGKWVKIFGSATTVTLE